MYVRESPGFEKKQKFFKKNEESEREKENKNLLQAQPRPWNPAWLIGQTQLSVNSFSLEKCRSDRDSVIRAMSSEEKTKKIPREKKFPQIKSGCGKLKNGFLN